MIGARLANLRWREKAGIAAALALVLVLVVDNLVARRLVRRVRDLGRAIKSEELNLAYYRGAVRVAPQVRADFEKVRERFEPAASPAVVLRKMKEQIDDVAVRSGLKITKMEDRERRQAEFCDEYVIDVASFEGDEKGVLRFISELWDSRGMPRVTKLSLAPNSAQGPGMVKGSMLITKAVEPEKPAAAPAAGAREENP